MPHIALPPDLPGIRGAMAFRPETARPLNALVEILLTGPSTLTRGERELIATYVSSLNCTRYCHSIHGAIAAAHLGGDEATVKQVKTDFTQASISPKLKALLTIAGKVQKDGKLVTAADVEAARKLGATDLEIHDTVLIAAAFCMYNRYVDGLDTIQPDDEALYRERGRRVARDGYVTVSEEYLAIPPLTLRSHSAHVKEKSMPHIELPEGLPGISAGFAFRPETAKPMRQLAHILLFEPSSLTPGERELIATYVSSQNNCQFCQLSHGAAAASHLGDEAIVKQVKTDFTQAPISDKLKALLVIAGKGPAGWKACDRGRRGGREEAGRDRPRDPRHSADCRRVLHVQPLRRRSRHLAAQDPGMYAQMGQASRREGLQRTFDQAATGSRSAPSEHSGSGDCTQKQRGRARLVPFYAAQINGAA